MISKIILGMVGVFVVFLGFGFAELSWAAAPDGCKTWFDGCNNCTRGSISDSWTCTKIACKGGNTALPNCREYFSDGDGQDINGDVNADIDGDGEITLLDALLVMKYVAGVSSDRWSGPSGLGEGDADCDGDVDLIDAILFAKKVVGMDMSGTKWCTNNDRGSFLETVRVF